MSADDALASEPKAPTGQTISERAVVKERNFNPFTRQWNQTGLEWIMAVFIAMTAGYLDGFGFFFLKSYVSFMSGNTTSAGVNVGQGHLAAALPFAIAIVCFVTGSFFGSLLSESGMRHSHQIMFGLIAAGIAAVASLEWAGLRHTFSETALMSLAMGMTNPALSRIGAESVSLTFVTGTLSRLGNHLALAARGKPVKDPRSAGDSHLRRALIEGSIWCGFFTGAVLGGVAGVNSRRWSLLPPFVVMVVLGLTCESITPQSGKPSRKIA